MRPTALMILQSSHFRTISSILTDLDFGLLRVALDEFAVCEKSKH